MSEDLNNRGEDDTSMVDLDSQSVSDIGNSSRNIGIGALIDKRSKLEEALDYVGVMIANLKAKRTSLEKDIEDEHVDIKKLKEKLLKANSFIDEEDKGITQLTQKRALVEQEADDIGNLIINLRDKLSGVDTIIENEKSKINDVKKNVKHASDT